MIKWHGPLLQWPVAEFKSLQVRRVCKKSQFPGQSNYSDLFGDVQIVNIQASPVILVSSRMPKKVKLIGSRVCYLYF